MAGHEDEWDESDALAARMEAGLQLGKLKIEVLGQWMWLSEAKQVADEIYAKIALAEETAKREPPPEG